MNSRKPRTMFLVPTLIEPRRITLMTLLSITLFFSLISAALPGEFVVQFKDKNLEAWKEVILSNKVLDGGPSWTVENGELQGSVLGGANSFLTIGNEKWKDYEVSYDVLPVKFHGAGNIAIAARVTEALMIVCMIGDSLNFFEPGEEPDEAFVPVSMATCFRCDITNFKEFLVLEKVPSPLLKLKEWAQLKLRVQGDTLSFWVNDELLIRVVMDPPVEEEAWPFLSGRVGLGLAGYVAKFDNLRVAGPDILEDGGFAVSPRGKLATTWGHLKGF